MIVRNLCIYSCKYNFSKLYRRLVKWDNVSVNNVQNVPTSRPTMEVEFVVVLIVRVLIKNCLKATQ